MKQSIIGLVIIIIIIAVIGFWISRTSQTTTEPAAEPSALEELLVSLQNQLDFEGTPESADLKWQVAVDNEIRTLTFSGRQLSLPVKTVPAAQQLLINQGFVQEPHNNIDHNSMDNESGIFGGYQKDDLVCLINHNESAGSLTCAQANSARESRVNYQATARELLMKEHELQADALQVEISHEGENHLRGVYTQTQDEASKNFLAAKIDSQWTLVFDSPDIFTCAVVDGLGFPYEMVKDCTSDQAMTVQVGEEFTVSLDGNPTTGYSWALATNSELVNLVDQEYQAHGAEMVGAGGQDIFTFQAQSVGQAELVFNYLRPWEGEPIKTRTYQITIIQE